MDSHTFFADTLLVSDIHAGWRFSRSDECAALIRNFRGRRLVILGDAFHHPRNRPLTRNRPLDGKTRNLIDAINRAAELGIEVIFVRGNHDPSAAFISALLPAATVCSEWHWQSGPTRCYAKHGHQHNGHNRHVWIIGDILREIPDYVHHFIQRLEGRRHRLSRFIRRLVERVFGLNNVLTAALAEHVAKRRMKIDVVFFGHTHFAEIRQLSDLRLCNPGCWVGNDDGVLSYATIDNEGKVEIKRYTP